MNNVFVYCEFIDGQIGDVSLELLTKGRDLANQLGCNLDAFILGDKLGEVEQKVFPYGVDKVYKVQGEGLSPYTTLPHAKILKGLIEKEQPIIGLFGATSVGRDLAPRVASSLKCGLTADCTDLVIGDHTDNKTKKEYHNLLYQIRPAFGGNIIATIVNPETRPQLATVREGVMKKQITSNSYKGEVVDIDSAEYLDQEDFAVQVLERHIEEKDIDIKNAGVLIAGGYGVGSKENFQLLYDFAEVIGADVGASRAAVDAGFVEHDRQVGQTGVTVRPKLYIACGISGQVQHRAGMAESSIIVSINSDENAPINEIADYVITGDLNEVIPKMIKSYKRNAK